MIFTVKAGTHEATNRSNTLLQQIALCVQSSDKSYALIAAIGSSDKSPGVNASTFGGRLIRILSPRQNSVPATKFSTNFSCSHDEICCCDVLLRRVAATCCSDLSPRVFRPLNCRDTHNG